MVQLLFGNEGHRRNFLHPDYREIGIAVHASHRNTGAGRALVEAAEHRLRADGCEFLEVHTVGPSYPHEGYAETRAFYRAVGFSPMHEFDGLDWDGPTVVMIKAL